MKAEMRRAMLLLSATTMALLALMACSGGSSQEEAKARPLPEDEKALRPGEYHSEEFKPSLTFSIGKGWSSVPPEASDLLGIAWGEARWVGFTNAQEVYKPTKTGTPNVVEAPEDMVGWFQNHPKLQSDKPEPVTVGGAKGVQFDVVVGDSPDNVSVVCGTGCVDIAKLNDGSGLAFVDGDKVRIIVLKDVKSETVTIAFGSPATEFDEFLPEAQKVLDSVKWRGT